VLFFTLRFLGLPQEIRERRSRVFGRGLIARPHPCTVVTLTEVMDQGLYYEDVQQLAREHGLPVSRTKDELIDELIESGELEPEEVVAFVRVDMLRVFLCDVGLPSGASRDVLADRLVEELSRRTKPNIKPRRSRLSESTTAPEVVNEPPEPGATVAPAPINLHVNLPTSPPPLVEVHFPRPERPSAAWGFAAILMAGIVGATLYIGVALLGVAGGVLASIGSAALLAVALLITARWWVPWVDGLAK
jgi:hypothetical protein